jgi:hypothetical protein
VVLADTTTFASISGEYCIAFNQGLNGTRRTVIAFPGEIYSNLPSDAPRCANHQSHGFLV